MDEICRAHQTRGYESLEALIADSDAVSLATPTSLHYDLGRTILESGRHVLIEKPITETAVQGWELVDIARRKGAVLYAGHTERFAPALAAARRWIKKPRYIEALRLAGFGLRGTDASVIDDLMIHDIDLVVSIVDSPVDGIEAVGVPVFTDNVDIANARLSFSDGTIATLTASRVSAERLRKLRLFQSDAYVSIDFLKRDSRVYRRKVDKHQIPQKSASRIDMEDLVEMLIPPVEEAETLVLEIKDFLKSIRGEKGPEVPGSAGVRALEVVTGIIEDIEGRLSGWAE
jgi:predicted dehydrogenase